MAGDRHTRSGCHRFSLREPQPGDVHIIGELERICFPDPWPERFFASELIAPGRFQQVLVSPAGDLVAYLFTAWQYLDLHVLKVATLPEVRRCGLARRLMLIAEEHCAAMGGEAITLEVRPSNTGAIALYQSMGYQLAGERSGYYASGENALIMTKSAGPPDHSNRV
jgi:ribosomal-protein-alanine N-acetyltransferase